MITCTLCITFITIMIVASMVGFYSPPFSFLPTSASFSFLRKKESTRRHPPAPICCMLYVGLTSWHTRVTVSPTPRSGSDENIWHTTRSRRSSQSADVDADSDAPTMDHVRLSATNISLQKKWITRRGPRASVALSSCSFERSRTINSPEFPYHSTDIDATSNQKSAVYRRGVRYVRGRGVERNTTMRQERRAQELTVEHTTNRGE
jgi:hypothetical protein